MLKHFTVTDPVVTQLPWIAMETMHHQVASPRRLNLIVSAHLQTRFEAWPNRIVIVAFLREAMFSVSVLTSTSKMVFRLEEGSIGMVLSYTVYFN